MSIGSINLELPSGLAMENLLAPLYNGEVGILALRDAAEAQTDEQGYALDDFVSSAAADFVPCVWVGKKIDERLVAEQTRTVAGYEISVMQQIGGTAVTVDSKARLAVKFQLGATDIQILQVLAVVNQQNLFWQIYAVDIDE